VWASFRECEKLSAVATGNRGSRATLVVTEECAPATALDKGI
jgi:hypothetical protein